LSLLGFSGLAPAKAQEIQLEMLAFAAAAAVFVPLIFLLAVDAGPLNRNVRLLLLGSLSTIPATVVEWQISEMATLVAPKTASGPLFSAFVLYALTEESVRPFTQNVVILDSKLSGSRGVFAALWLGLGFSVFENFAYIFSYTQPDAVAFGRIFMSTPKHLFCAATMAGFVLRILPGGQIPALLIPVSIHGPYDYFVIGSIPNFSAASSFLFLGLLITGLVFKRAKRSLQVGAQDG
jgi:RsiW-degrading membrane proteinase PrsW (M82 family)